MPGFAEMPVYPRFHRPSTNSACAPVSRSFPIFLCATTQELHPATTHNNGTRGTRGAGGRRLARHGTQTAPPSGVQALFAVRILLALVGFVTGAAIAAGTIALATELAHGRPFRNVVRRPVIRVLAAIYAAACGVAGALFAYGLG